MYRIFILTVVVRLALCAPALGAQAFERAVTRDEFQNNVIRISFDGIRVTESQKQEVRRILDEEEKAFYQLDPKAYDWRDQARALMRRRTARIREVLPPGPDRERYDKNAKVFATLY